MKKFVFLFPSLTLAVLALSACASLQPEPTPTATPLPPTVTLTRTPKPPTDTPVPRLMPTKTSTPTATSTVTVMPAEMGTLREVPSDGFSFNFIDGLYMTSLPNGVTLENLDGSVFIAVFGFPVAEYENSEDAIDSFLRGFEMGGHSGFERGEPYPITVDSVEGEMIDIRGTFFDAPMFGQAFAVLVSEDHTLTAMVAVSPEVSGENGEGYRKYTQALLSSLTFMEINLGAESHCPVATDPTYGYYKNNPIKVGGDAMDGPSRERAYLTALCGPNGEPLEFKRLGSEPYGDTILDAYEVTCAGSDPVILYLDEYSYSQPVAPAGLHCWSQIPLSRA